VSRAWDWGRALNDHYEGGWWSHFGDADANKASLVLLDGISSESGDLLEEQDLMAACGLGLLVGALAREELPTPNEPPRLTLELVTRALRWNNDLAGSAVVEDLDWWNQCVDGGAAYEFSEIFSSLIQDTRLRASTRLMLAYDLGLLAGALARDEGR
jgi:hypothetical protein